MHYAVFPLKHINRLKFVNVNLCLDLDLDLISVRTRCLKKKLLLYVSNFISYAVQSRVEYSHAHFQLILIFSSFQ